MSAILRQRTSNVWSTLEQCIKISRLRLITKFNVTLAVCIVLILRIHTYIVSQRRCESVSLTSLKDTGKIRVYFNVFTGGTKEADREHVYQIMREQLSFKEPYHEIVVNTIGQELNLTKVCPTCIQNTHFQNGYEETTLTDLHNYCRDNPHQKVGYLHSKGSFHPTKENEILRIFLTRGVLSEECARLPEECTICSTSLAMIPHMHVPGNMFFARCSYINKLLPPKEYQTAIYDLRIRYGLQEMENSTLGIGRFAFERWVTGHPDVRPCDLAKLSGSIAGHCNLKSEWKTHPRQWSIDLQHAPREKMSFYRIDNNHPWDDKHQVGWGVDLQARLSEWHFLYKRVPKPDSWIWSYWDTEELRQHIKANKMSYMRPDFVREIYRLYPEARRGPPPSNELVNGGPFEGDGIMLFFNFWVNSLLGSHDIFNEQMQTLSQSHQKFIVNVYHLGKSDTSDKHLTDWKAICDKHGIECRSLGRLSRGREKKTLGKLREYCLVNPDRNVVYIHNKGSEHSRNGWNTHLRSFMMRAVTSPQCLKMPNYCNVCGASFSPLPYAAFHGNFWVARCSYVNKLLSVAELDTKLTDFRDKFVGPLDLLLKKGGEEKETRSMVNFKLPPETDGIPTGKTAEEYWIASHPDMQPCDLYNGEHKPMWRIEYSPKTTWEIDLQRAPRGQAKDFICDDCNMYTPPPNETRIYHTVKTSNYKWSINKDNRISLLKFVYGKEPAEDNWVRKFLL